MIVRDPGRRRQLARDLARARDSQVVAAFGTLQDAISLAQSLQPIEVLIIDVDHPEMKEMRFWATVKSLIWRDVHIVALTQGHDPRVLEIVLGIGVNGLHPPDVAPGALYYAVKRAALGKVDFDPELAERAKRVLMGPLQESQIQVGGLMIDLQTCGVRRWNVPIELTDLEFTLLACLAQRYPQPVGIPELLECVWGTSMQYAGTEDQVKSCVRRLRRKIEPDPKHPRYLLNMRARGYLLHDPLHNAAKPRRLE